MATIAGSHFTASASSVAYPGGVNIVETSTGTGLAAAIPTDFNLEVYTGPTAGAPTAPFSGYQGLAVLSPGGFELDLISGAYAVTDAGAGGDTLNAEGTNETIIGGGAFSNLFLTGNNDAAQGGAGGNFIEVSGTGDTVTAGSGLDVINVTASGNTVVGGSGPDIITALGSNESITGGGSPGGNLVNAVGAGDTITAGSGGGMFNVIGDNNTVNGGSGSDTIGLYGNDDVANGGSGGGSVIATGMGDTVNAGVGNLNINADGASFQFNDTASVYHDTVVGFSTAAGDHIHLEAGHTVASLTPANGGQDTLITLSDNSTILLKGVTNVDNTFFN